MNMNVDNFLKFLEKERDRKLPVRQKMKMHVKGDPVLTGVTAKAYSRYAGDPDRSLKLHDNMLIVGDLTVNTHFVKKLPLNLQVTGKLIIEGTPTITLPESLEVDSLIDLTQTTVKEIPSYINPRKVIVPSAAISNLPQEIRNKVHISRRNLHLSEYLKNPEEYLTVGKYTVGGYGKFVPYQEIVQNMSKVTKRQFDLVEEKLGVRWEKGLIYEGVHEKLKEGQVCFAIEGKLETGERVIFDRKESTSRIKDPNFFTKTMVYLRGSNMNMPMIQKYSAEHFKKTLKYVNIDQEYTKMY